MKITLAVVAFVTLALVPRSAFSGPLAVCRLDQLVPPGTAPVPPPFDVAIGQVTATQGSQPHLFQDVRIWFQYTAPAVGTVPQPHDDGPVNTTIRCDETGQEFQFEL